MPCWAEDTTPLGASIGNGSSGEREPDYRITHEDAAGLTEFGAAWKRESKKGRPFLSIVFEDPALPGPVNAALFPSDVDATARLVWQRPAKKDLQPEDAITLSRCRQSDAPQLG